MSKTHFSNRCQVLHDFWLFYKDDPLKGEVWDNFFDWADVGMPLAYMIVEGIATISEDNEHFVNDVWDEMCRMLSVDPKKDFATLEDIFSASPNEPIDND